MQPPPECIRLTHTTSVISTWPKRERMEILCSEYRPVMNMCPSVSVRWKIRTCDPNRYCFHVSFFWATRHWVRAVNTDACGLCTTLACKPATWKTDYNKELEKLAMSGFETWQVYPQHGFSRVLFNLPPGVSPSMWHVSSQHAKHKLGKWQHQGQDLDQPQIRAGFYFQLKQCPSAMLTWGVQNRTAHDRLLLVT